MSIVWQADPLLQPPRGWPRFALPEIHYALGAMESVVSTMETQALGGRNVANLVARHLRKTPA